MIFILPYKEFSKHNANKSNFYMFFKQIILHNDYNIYGSITYWNKAILTQISNKTMSSETLTNVQPN